MCGTVRSVTDAMASEEDEVRALLMRHRKQIIRDFNESKLIAILTQKGVLNVSSERLFNEISSLVCNEPSDKIVLNPKSTTTITATTTTTTTITPTLPIIDNVPNPTTTPTPTTNSNCDIVTNTEINEKKCTFLIDVISKNGFEKFKEFCYAIESECPQLIEDLINDRIKGGKFDSKTKKQKCYCVPLNDCPHVLRTFTSIYI